LKNKTLLLRGKYVEKDLSFDAMGNVTGTATPGPFSASAIHIEKIRLKNATLDIEGRRGVLIDTGISDPVLSSDIRFVLTPAKVRITIVGDAAHPEGLPLLAHKIFAASIDDALAGKTEEARKAELFTLACLHAPAQSTPVLPAPSTVTLSPAEMNALKPISNTGAGTIIASPRANTSNVTAPRIISSEFPEFTDEAKKKLISGICVLGLIVDQTGFPIRIHIVRSLDPGLDQNAIAAVSQYRFKPALHQGQPVPVEVNIEVNFGIR
jgi:TonB family protein